MIRKLIIIGVITVTASFAQTADTTNKSSKSSNTTTSSTVVTSTEVSFNKGLKKQQKVTGTTTWSKIKDLFN